MMEKPAQFQLLSERCGISCTMDAPEHDFFLKQILERHAIDGSVPERGIKTFKSDK
jgi:hypothetical protein